MEYDCLISHLKNKFKKQLEIDFKNGSIYSEAELQCILYGELRKFCTFVYPETWYGNNRADLVILEKSITDIRKNDSKKIENLSFNIAKYDKKICSTIIELKYGYSIGNLKKSLELDMVALINDGNYGNRFLLYILDRRHIKNKKYILNGIEKLTKDNLISEAEKTNYFNNNTFEKEDLKKINIIGYIWDGEKLELINN